MVSGAPLLRGLLAVALLACVARAGFDTSCTYSQSNTEWVNNDKRIEGVYSSLSGCQAQKMGFGTQTNDLLIGGSGSAAIVGVPVESGNGGCKSGTECMKWCQALCCLAKGCVYASIKQDKDVDNYVVYEEEQRKFSCRMYGSGSLKDSDSQSTCTKKASNYCDDLVLVSFNMDANAYNQMLGLQNYQTCPAKRRSLLEWTNPRRSPAEIKAKLAAIKKKMADNPVIAKLKSKVQDLKAEGKLRSIIQGSGVCKA